MIAVPQTVARTISIATVFGVATKWLSSNPSRFSVIVSAPGPQGIVVMDHQGAARAEGFAGILAGGHEVFKYNDYGDLVTGEWWGIGNGLAVGDVLITEIFYVPS